MTDKSGPKNPHGFGLTLVFFAFQLFVRSSFFGLVPNPRVHVLFWCTNLGWPLSLSPENGVREDGCAIGKLAIFFGEFKLDAKMSGSFEAFPL